MNKANVFRILLCTAILGSCIMVKLAAAEQVPGSYNPNAKLFMPVYGNKGFVPIGQAIAQKRTIVPLKQETLAQNENNTNKTQKGGDQKN